MKLLFGDHPSFTCWLWCVARRSETAVGRTTPNTLNPAELNNGNHGAPEFKGDGFNSILASEILIKSATTGRHSQLGMSKVSNLRELFAGPTTRLNVVSGDAKPQQLMSGGSNGACGVAWRTNSGGGTHGKHKVRIGGYFTAAWGCDYGADSNGDPTAAEQAGVGLWDMHWSPFRLTVSANCVSSPMTPSPCAAASCIVLISKIPLPPFSSNRAVLPAFVKLMTTTTAKVVARSLLPPPSGCVKR
jgi:hypothetical protein